MLITQQMINEFEIHYDIVHNDTTSAFVYGNYDNSDTGGSIKINYGFIKKHRQDLKQLVWSMSVSSDHAFPLFQQAYSGNTADVDTYVEQWHNLIDLLGKDDFLFVADSKLITKGNITHIHNNDGFFLAPVPIYETYKDTTYKNKKKGESAKGKKRQKVKVVKDFYSIELMFKQRAYQDELYICGYYPLITNMPQETFTIKDAMLNHKNQYKSEHINRRAKGEHHLEPIYLHKPERIEVYLFLFKIDLQLLVIIERTARRNIARRDKGLDNFRPNRKDVRNPKSEYLFQEFQYVVRGKIFLQNGDVHHFVSELNDLQKDILDILEVPPPCFTYDYLFGAILKNNKISECSNQMH